MGKGGQEQATVLATASSNTNDHKKTLPTGSIQAKTRPGVTWKSPYDPFSSTKLPTKGQVKAVIPAHCFERSYVQSFFYLFRDLVMATACVLTAQHCLSTSLPSNDSETSSNTTTALLLWTAGWSVYAVCMGTVCTGLWVLAHECGHGAFTDSALGTRQQCRGVYSPPGRPGHTPNTTVAPITSTTENRTSPCSRKASGWTASPTGCWVGP